MEERKGNKKGELRGKMVKRRVFPYTLRQKVLQISNLMKLFDVNVIYVVDTKLFIFKI
jgi:hypothetical protein